MTTPLLASIELAHWSASDIGYALLALAVLAAGALLMAWATTKHSTEGK